MYDKYIVKEGDNLNSIASNFNVDVNKLKDINNLEEVREGIELLIPKDSEDYYSMYTINKGDNLYQISKKYNINPILLAALNGLNENDYIYPNQEILIPKNGYSYYITTSGDTIDIVADKFNITKSDLIKGNTIYLLPGQILAHKKN